MPLGSLYRFGYIPYSHITAQQLVVEYRAIECLVVKLSLVVEQPARLYSSQLLMMTLLINMLQPTCRAQACATCACGLALSRVLGAGRRLVPHRRPGLPGRRGLCDADRAPQGAHQPRRREDLAH